jgi:RecJ-like exonuclease
MSLEQRYRVVCTICGHISESYWGFPRMRDILHAAGWRLSVTVQRGEGVLATEDHCPKCASPGEVWTCHTRAVERRGQIDLVVELPDRRNEFCFELDTSIDVDDEWRLQAKRISEEIAKRLSMFCVRKED